jgi:hypothetical protein
LLLTSFNDLWVFFCLVEPLWFWSLDFRLNMSWDDLRFFVLADGSMF